MSQETSMTLEKALRLALRKKYRFQTHLGQLTVEELFDSSFPLQSRGSAQTSLDSIGVALKKKLDSAGEVVSLVSDTNKPDIETEAKFVIVKHIIETRVAEQEAQKNRQARKAKQARILQLIEEKEDTDLSAKSTDELKALLGETEAEEDSED